MNTHIKNFHLPLPANLYHQLQREAKVSRQPITKLARQVIEAWVHQRHKKAIENSLQNYVNLYAGTEFDLDEDLERTSIEHIMQEELV
jgi:hypothetical protein